MFCGEIDDPILLDYADRNNDQRAGQWPARGREGSVEVTRPPDSHGQERYAFRLRGVAYGSKVGRALDR